MCIAWKDSGCSLGLLFRCHLFQVGDDSMFHPTLDHVLPTCRFLGRAVFNSINQPERVANSIRTSLSEDKQQGRSNLTRILPPQRPNKNPAASCGAEGPLSCQLSDQMGRKHWYGRSICGVGLCQGSGGHQNEGTTRLVEIRPY